MTLDFWRHVSKSPQTTSLTNHLGPANASMLGHQYYEFTHAPPRHKGHNHRLVLLHGRSAILSSSDPLI